MNYRMTGYMLGIISVIEALLMLLPFTVGIIYGEDTLFAFGISMLCLLALGVPLILQKPKNINMNVKGGLITVALTWIVMSVFATFPLLITKEIPNFVDAFFEVVSGFTTCGATIVPSVENLSYSINFWRCLTHWIGGMGILVFVIALLPKTDGQIMHLFRAESPGPVAGKLVAKLRFTARILYAIYIVFTLICIILLRLGGMNTFDSIIHSFSAISTGGFGNKNASIGFYNSVYIEIVLVVFMFLGSINFNMFYLLLIGNVKSVLKNEELRAYIIIIFVCIFLITMSLTINNVYSFSQSLRYSTFSFVSIITTTGFIAADFSSWPLLTQVLLFIAMFIGGCAGSTAGGFKVSRVVILTKSGAREFRRAINPRLLSNVKMDGKPINSEVVFGTYHYLLIYLAVYAVSVILVAVDSQNIIFDKGFVYCLSSVATCLNDVGPGLGTLAAGNFANFSVLSKIVLTLDMLLGRLEIFPVLMLFYPRAWAKY